MKYSVAVIVAALCLTAVKGSTLDAMIAEEGAASPSFSMFQAFAHEFGRVYDTPAEMSRRFAIFQQNQAEAAEQNLESPLAEYGVTRFSDLTEGEFEAYLGFDVSMASSPNPEFVATHEEAALRRKLVAPDNDCDWREKMNPIKDQKSCGSCWAFSAEGAVEGAFLANGYGCVDASEQMLIDCDKKSAGCRGGLMDTAIALLSETGVYSQESYPYHAKNEKCHIDTAEHVQCTSPNGENVECPPIKLHVACAHMKGLPEDVYTDYDCTDEDHIARVQHQPQAIAINAKDMMRYRGGVATPSARKCNPKGLNHGVVTVGYTAGNANEPAHYIIRNSWGTRWGEKGHYRVASGQNACGIDAYQVEAVIVE